MSLVKVDSLIDRWLPVADCREKHSIVTKATKASLYKTLKEGALTYGALTQLLMRVRFLASRKKRETSASSFLQRALRLGFVILDDQAEDEIVLGFAGRFWRPVPEILPISASEFREFNLPGTAKAVVNFKFTQLADGNCCLATETRVSACDSASRHKLKIYWALIRPFSGMIRKNTLLAVSRLSLP